MSEQSQCRIRITFAKTEAIRYVAHLDLLRAWERLFRRAKIPLAYSQGFNPHPKITIAMPSPVGCTGAREELDVILYEPLPEEAIVAQLRDTLPAGIEVIATEPVPLKAPARPSLIRCAHYQATLVDVPFASVEQRIRQLMACDTMEVEFRRKEFDIRPLIGRLDVERSNDTVLLTMELLRSAQGRIGRPDVVLEALGLTKHARLTHRTHIVFDPDHPSKRPSRS